jgi:phenylalanyl-tRNA synthetase beta chain
MIFYFVRGLKDTASAVRLCVRIFLRFSETEKSGKRMKISLNWLKEYVPVEIDYNTLAEKLTMAGTAVEETIPFSIPQGIVVSEIKERRPHPNADKLSVCAVFDGERDWQVVCGAPNCDAGQKVPLAKIATVFRDKQSGKDFKIEKREIRKVVSEGMLCGAQELGFEEKSEGLLILDSSISCGKPLNEIYPDDVVLDLEITPNRPDLLSHIGIARDISALCRIPLKTPSAKIAKPAHEVDFAVEVEAPELCPRYTARIIKNVTVKESPAWLREKLIKIGLRPINNIVDITNFVLFETGQPLHAFDLSLLKGKIVVRRARNAEKIKTLDGTELELNKDILVICDEKNPVALAGIMGGENSGIGALSKDILLEGAYFAPSNIRASSKKLQISSDSSYRFERGVDIEGVSYASDRAASLILEIAGGEISSALIDVKEKIPAPDKIHCRFEKIKKLLGMDLPNTEIISIFERLGISVLSADEQSCSAAPPSYRSDIKCEADLAEEILRIHGISEIPIPPVRPVSGGAFSDDAYYMIESFRNGIISLGLTECLNYSFFDKKSALLDTRFSVETIAPIANPLSKDSEFMRPSLLAGILSSINRNISRGARDLSLFEMGNVFSMNGGKIEERLELCVSLTGRRHPERFSAEKSLLYDFSDIKGLAESIFEMRGFDSVSFEKIASPADKTLFSPEALSVLIGGVPVGIFGRINAGIAADMRLKAPLYIGLFGLSSILKFKSPKIVFSAFSQYPAITRDIAMAADESVENSVIADFI